jgi:hypothetical protein
VRRICRSLLRAIHARRTALKLRALLGSFGEAAVAIRYREHLPSRDFIVHICRFDPDLFNAVSAVSHVI